MANAGRRTKFLMLDSNFMFSIIVEPDNFLNKGLVSRNKFKFIDYFS